MAFEITTEELTTLVLWGDHFVEWEEGESAEIAQNEEGLRTSSELHHKLFEELTQRIMEEERGEVVEGEGMRR